MPDGASVSSLRETVLFDWHTAHGAKMVPFAGWMMPLYYPAGIFAEHQAARA
ncbi:MAG: glycine cleavage system aminomethyltransferase GcvT, partial [Planctomycetota bacterium]